MDISPPTYLMSRSHMHCSRTDYILPIVTYGAAWGAIVLAPKQFYAAILSTNLSLWVSVSLFCALSLARWRLASSVSVLWFY
ncbi:hypothetical protein C8F01DRAFT_127768 [Mycena amicta]|nr:hypothetical protein C8F01DRAFT_127768 [Mycena amicta]